jgi:hypothetical protein
LDAKIPRGVKRPAETEPEAYAQYHLLKNISL